jgi:hypothetical protein
VEHRKQNRYHSNLKRVREKERKANGPGGVGAWSAWTPTNLEAARNESPGEKEKESTEESPDTRIRMAQGRESEDDDVSVACIMEAQVDQLRLISFHRPHPDQKAKLSLQELKVSDAQTTFVLSRPASNFFLPVCRGRCARLVGLAID